MLRHCQVRAVPPAERAHARERGESGRAPPVRRRRADLGPSPALAPSQVAVRRARRSLRCSHHLWFSDGRSGAVAFDSSSRGDGRPKGLARRATTRRRDRRRASRAAAARRRCGGSCEGTSKQLAVRGGRWELYARCDADFFETSADVCVVVHGQRRDLLQPTTLATTSSGTTTVPTPTTTLPSTPSAPATTATSS